MRCRAPEIAHEDYGVIQSNIDCAIVSIFKDAQRHGTRPVLLERPCFDPKKLRMEEVVVRGSVVLDVLKRNAGRADDGPDGPPYMVVFPESRF